MASAVKDGEIGATTFDKVKGILAYSACSSMMLLVNKLVLQYINVSTFVGTVQFSLCVIFVVIFKSIGYIEPDELEMSKLKPFSVYVILFVLGIYCNMQALSVANVDTVIVFRSCSPLAVSILDWMFMGRELPSKRSTAALVALLVGVYGYVSSDKEFQMQGIAAYTWVSMYFVIISIEMTYGKWLVSALDFKDRVWGSVYYTNILSVVPMALLGMVTGDMDKMDKVTWTREGLIYLMISSAIGIGISYAGFNARNLVSATTFTLVGVINKLATILINVLIWDNHASTEGLVFLVLCILASSFYRQAGLRKDWVANLEQNAKSDGSVVVEMNTSYVGGRDGRGSKPA